MSPDADLPYYKAIINEPHIFSSQTQDKIKEEEEHKENIPEEHS